MCYEDLLYELLDFWNIFNLQRATREVPQMREGGLRYDLLDRGRGLRRLGVP